MYRAFNMGIGMIVACAEPDVTALMSTMAAAGEDGAVAIGQTVPGDKRVVYV